MSSTDDANPVPAPTALPEDDAPIDDALELSFVLAEDEDLDDAVASELDSGVDVTGEDEDGGDGDEPALDIGAAAFDPRLPERSEEGDETGPVGESEDSDVGREEVFDADETEGGSDSLDELVGSDLPALSAEAELDMGFDDEPIVLATAGVEEDSLRNADPLWAEIPLPKSLPPCTAVAVERAGSSVLGGGTELFTVDDAGIRRTLAANLDDTVTSLVPGAEPGAVLFTTRGGELRRSGAGKAVPERLVAMRDATTAGPVGAPEVRLGGPTPSQRPAILLLVSDSAGTLLESTDYGTTWRRVELGGRVVALSNGSPPICLVDTGRATRFFLSEPSGGFSPVGAPFAGDADALSISTHDEAVVLLSPGHGVSVSANRGAGFKSVPGCARASAITAGRLGGRISAFSALFDESSGRATLVCIDAVSADASAIASIEPGEDDDDDLCRVVSLAWDPHTETLWAAGAFGVRRFRRPPSA